ncbi:LCP family protein [Leptolyngbya sp. FACHB-541]|uniref:LCP family protein n=1 Tax=Leptolyngbya sp. FACHB-541 TaxID=2692810 RepID=UPI00322065A1
MRDGVDGLQNQSDQYKTQQSSPVQVSEEPSDSSHIPSASTATATASVAAITPAQLSDQARLVRVPERSPSKPNPLRWLGWGAALVTTGVVSGVLGVALSWLTPLPPTLASDTDPQLSLSDLWSKGFRYNITRPVNILVMGIDRVPDVPPDSPEVLNGRSDTMLLVQVDPEDNSINVLSIPRDTQVEIPGVGLTKINHANMLGGDSLAARVVSRNLNGVPIDRYVRVSTEAFRELVDLLGGVEVFVPQRMSYTDETQKLYIDLEQGWQNLNGDQAEQFARFRADGNGDIGRVQRQQQLIRALRDRITSPAVIPKLPEAIQLVQKYVDTNLSLEEMLALANFGVSLEQDSFRMVMLPGRFSTADEFVASYWITDSDAVDQVMQEYFQVPSITSSEERRALNHLYIAVQNASGEPQLGNQVASYLQEQGFDNVYVIQDWPDRQMQTDIIVQRGDMQGAALLENVLGLGRVVSASTGDLQSDLTIRVGEDWADRIDG